MIRMAQIASLLGILLWAGAGSAAPITIPIVITDCSQSKSGCVNTSTSCTYANGPAGLVVGVMVLTNSSNAGVTYGLSGQNAQLFAVSGSNIIIGSAGLNPSTPTTYVVDVQSSPAVDFTLYCGPTATSGSQPPS